MRRRDASDRRPRSPREPGVLADRARGGAGPRSADRACRRTRGDPDRPRPPARGAGWGGLFLRGSLEGRSRMRCARCLKAFERDFDVEMPELVAREPGPDDDYALEPALTLAPEPIVRDAVVLEMPFSPLCRPDCLGLCEICGGDRNLGECPGHDVTHPRWDALDVLMQHLETQPEREPSDDDDRTTTS